MGNASTNQVAVSQTPHKLATIHHDLQDDMYDLQIGEARFGISLTIAQLEAVHAEIERIFKELTE